jgi:hypothetical protein
LTAAGSAAANASAIARAVRTIIVLVSSMPESSQPERRRPAGVGGWLLLLCRLLIIFQPLSFAVTAVGALDAVSVRGAPVALILALRLLVVALGVAAGRALQNLRPGAVALAKAALLISAATDLFVYTTPYFPSNRLPGDTLYYVVASLAYHAAWLAYLSRSRRVRNTFS